MLKGFKDFILRGNVIDLAVAVVIGAAFTALIAAITANLIEPVLNALGGVDAGGWGFYVNPDKPDTFINVGAIITAFITFLITAAVVYFVFIAPMKAINIRLSAQEDAGEGRPHRGRSAGRDPRPAEGGERRRCRYRFGTDVPGLCRKADGLLGRRTGELPTGSAVVRWPVLPVPPLPLRPVDGLGIALVAGDGRQGVAEHLVESAAFPKSRPRVGLAAVRSSVGRRCPELGRRILRSSPNPCRAAGPAEHHRYIHSGSFPLPAVYRSPAAQKARSRWGSSTRPRAWRTASPTRSPMWPARHGRRRRTSPGRRRQGRRHRRTRRREDQGRRR